MARLPKRSRPHATPKLHHMPHQIMSLSPSQLALVIIITTRQALAKCNIVVADRRVAVLLQCLSCRPDLLASLFLLRRMLHDDLAATLLEEQGALLHVRVQLAIDENTSVYVLLSTFAQDFVLGHDALVDDVEAVKLLASAVAVLPDFVVHDTSVGTGRHEFLHEHEVRASRC
jgi:hypothetical protein